MEQLVVIIVFLIISTIFRSLTRSGKKAATKQQRQFVNPRNLSPESPPPPGKIGDKAPSFVSFDPQYEETQKYTDIDRPPVKAPVAAVKESSPPASDQTRKQPGLDDLLQGERIPLIVLSAEILSAPRAKRPFHPRSGRDVFS